MVVSNDMSQIRSAIYRNRNEISSSAIIDIHGLCDKNKNTKEINYEKIIAIVEHYNKNKNIHFVVNNRITRSSKINIKIQNI